MAAGVVLNVPVLRREDWPEIRSLSVELPETFDEWQASALGISRQFEADPRFVLRNVPVTVADFRREFVRLGRPLASRDRARLAVEVGVAQRAAQAENNMADDLPHFPDGPAASREQLEECQRRGDFRPVLFDWYKHVGLLCNLCASIELASSALDEIEPRHFAVLIGQLNRCGRLILANVHLSHDGGLFGETTAIVDRAIFESAAKVMWLSESDAEDRFDRYFADHFKTDLELRDRILANIAARGDAATKLEAGMLASIQARVATTGMTEAQLRGTKPLPDIAAMLQSTGRDRLLYTVGQKIGSHHVHGSWASLLLHYLDEMDDGTFKPRDHDCPTDINQYAFVSMLLLEAMGSFIRFIVTDEAYAARVVAMFEGRADAIMKIYLVAKGYETLDGQA